MKLILYGELTVTKGRGNVIIKLGSGNPFSSVYLGTVYGSYNK